MIAHEQVHIIDAPAEGLDLRPDHLLMLNLVRLELRYLVMHHVKDVLGSPRLVKDGVVESVRVLKAVFQPGLLLLKDGLGFSRDVCDRFDHVVTDHLDARLDIEPVKLVHLVSHKIVIKPVLLLPVQPSAYLGFNCERCRVLIVLLLSFLPIPLP